MERFDRIRDGDDVVRRVPLEDAAQVMNLPPASKYAISSEDVVLALAGLCKARPVAVRNLYLQFVFAWLTGNGDLHGKNLSVRQAPDGLWEVTPVYDLLCTQPYAGWADPMAVPLYGRANRLGRRWWLDAAQRWGLPERAVARSLDRIAAAVLPWADRVGEIGFDDATYDRLAALLRERAGELTG